MKKDQPSSEIVKEMLVEFTEYKSNLLRTKRKNEDEIEEIERYLKSLFVNEEFNYKVFSPRNVESIYKEEIEELNSKKSMLESKSHSFIRKIAFFVDKIEKLEKILDIEEVREIEEQTKEEIGEQLKEETGEQLKEEIREQLKEEIREQLKEEIGEQLKEEIGEQLKEEIREQLKEEIREQPKEEIEEQPKEEIREQLKEEIEEQPKEEIREQPKEEIREQPKAEIEKKEQNLKVLNLQELERQRIARDLHDTTVQNLVHLIHKIELCSKYMDQDIIRARLEIATITKDIKNVINDMRDTIFNLRSMTFDDIGWEATIQQLIEELQNKTDLIIAHTVDDISMDNPTLQISIIRIIQECCMNAIKHSKGKNIDISVKCSNDDIVIRIKDDGMGFQVSKEEEPTSSRHFGLEMTRERVHLLSGTVKINSDRELGTEVVVEIPR